MKDADPGANPASRSIAERFSHLRANAGGAAVIRIFISGGVAHAGNTIQFIFIDTAVIQSHRAARMAVARASLLPDGIRAAHAERSHQHFPTMAHVEPERTSRDPKIIVFS